MLMVLQMRNEHKHAAIVRGTVAMGATPHVFRGIYATCVPTVLVAAIILAGRT